MKVEEGEKPWEAEKKQILLDKITASQTVIGEGKKYKLLVSNDISTVEDVKQLGSKVQKIIEERKFPTKGINKERHNFCSNLFDELIRQVIVEHPDIGAILLKIRDHYRQEIYNYEQVYKVSQAYGCRKQFMEKNDDRLNELETEAEYLLKRQKKANLQVERAYEEHLKLIAECEEIDVDDVEYWRAVQFYQNYIKYLLYYFDLRAEEEKIKEGIEDKEEETDEEEQEVETEGIESFTLGDDVLEEEEEEVPGNQEEEVKVDTTKQQKEETIDKDLIYRENEEEVFDSDLDTEQTFVSELPKSEDDVLPPTETDPVEHLQTLLEEELKYDISFSDVARGYVKKAYEDELKKVEEQKKLVQEKIEQQKMAKRLKEEIRGESAENISEEGSEEGHEEEESVQKETLQHMEKIFTKGIGSLRTSSVYEDLDYQKGSEDSKTDKEMPFLTKPKYALLRRLTAPLKCKDLVPKVPGVEPIRRRKVKKVLVKKGKAKPKVHKPVEEEEPQEVVKESFEDSSTAVKATEFKWGIPLSEYLAQLGRLVTIEAAPEKTIEEGMEDMAEVPPPEEESELFSSGLTIGKTESYHSSKESKDRSVSINEEEEDEKEKSKAEELEEEEENDDF